MAFELQNLALGRARADRHAHLRHELEWWQGVSQSADTKVVVVNASSMAVIGNRLRLLSATEVSGLPLAYLGEADGTHYVSVLVDSDEWPSDWQWESLRTLGHDLDDLESGLATTAVALSNWHRNHTHCPRCGAATFIVKAGWVRQCPEDGSEHFPRMDNAVIAVVVDSQDRLLLARQTVWQPNHYSLVAGFVEPGETFEAAVAREVFEETGIRTTNPRVVGNQPWPFPASMMIGFFTEATTTDITVDGEEIAEAQWFTKDELVEACMRGDVRLPTRTSIARRLIEHWYGAELSNEWTRS